MKPFLHTLAEGPILFDGAMGSLLYDRGVLHTRSYDELVTAQPDLIARVHRDYIDAGAQVIETDTANSPLAMRAPSRLRSASGTAAGRGAAAPEVIDGTCWVGFGAPSPHPTAPNPPSSR